MNYRILLKIIGEVLIVEAAFMLVPLIISLAEQTFDSFGIFISIIICAGAGLPLAFIKNKKELRARDGITAVALCWVIISFMGALPFYFSGAIDGFVNCFFEAASGFTTTGATILEDVGAMPDSLLMWRALMHWIGGMGVIVFVLVLSSRWKAKSLHLMSVESTGPIKGKLLPSVAKTAKMLYLIYTGFTFVEAVCLIIAGMPVFDAFLHAFSTAGTGGFSMTNASVAAYDSTAIHVIITVFMLLFSISFTLHFHMLRGNFKEAIKNTELKIYLCVVGAVMAIITFNIASLYNYDYGLAFRDAAFQTAAISSTTGFSTADFNTWPMLSKILLIMLMFLGGMSGSTGGGVKYLRAIIGAKALRRDLKKSLHPNLVETVRIGDITLPEPLISRVLVFFFAHIVIVGIATFIVSFDNLDFTTSFTAALTSISNVGPGLSLIGPAGNFAMFSDLSKVTLSICMMIGRLEIFPFLILFAPRTWRI